jgi:RHS repeat-associated protein
MITNRSRAARRLTFTIAAGLVVVLGIDPGLLGLGWSSAAHALTNDVNDNESRAQNFDTAVTSLNLRTASPSNPRVGNGGGGLVPTTPVELNLPTALPQAAQAPIDVSTAEGNPPTDLGGMEVSAAPSDGPAPEQVSVKVYDQATTEQAGITGVLLEVTDASTTPAVEEQSVDLTVSYADFAGVGGGDWASRVHAMWVPDCEPGSGSAPECRSTPLETIQDEAAQTVTVTVPVHEGTSESASAPAALRSVSAAAAAPGAVAITSGVAGPLGDWSATALAPSSTWGTTGATSAFNWSYPMRVPQVPAGPTPQVGLSYSSAASDGRIPSSNNQSGLIGEGFDAGASFIERRFKSCADDETGNANNIGLSAPDLCWGPENAVLSLNGTATELVKSGNTWVPKRHDGTKVDYKSSGGPEGEYWIVTTVNGTKYTFGGTGSRGSAWTVPVYGNHPGEPCYTAAFVDSSCSKVWRWNLDRVEDPSKNIASYYYTKETNHYRPYYGTAQVSYVAGGYLTRIDYGRFVGDGFSRAPAKVEFGYGPRCITTLSVDAAWCTSSQTSTYANHWPDTPIDLICAAGAACTTYAPTFFNRTRLSKITTYVATETSYKAVDLWNLSQHFVPQGDESFGLEYATGIHLILDGIRHTGKGGDGDVELPRVTLDYKPEKNRVENADTGADAIARHRLNHIVPESGGQIDVIYTTTADCTAAAPDDPANNQLCYPVKWQHPQELQPRTDYFRKWVVQSISEQPSGPLVAGQPELITSSLSKVTQYDYSQAAWKWVKPEDPLIDDVDETFSEFRGAKQIVTISGASGTQQTKTATSYYRGAGEQLVDPVTNETFTDVERFTGEAFTTTVLNGGTKKATETTTVLQAETVADSSAQRISGRTDYAVTYRADGTTPALRTKSETTFNEYSQPTRIKDLGDIALTSDDLCTTTSYAHTANATLKSAYLVALPSAVKTLKAECAPAVITPADLVSASQITYDAAGRPTKAETLDPTDGDGYITASTTVYNPRGIVTSTADAAGQVTTIDTSINPAGLITEIATTNPLGHVTRTTLDPFLGVPTQTTDANGRATKATYDSLGRLETVVYPQHDGGSIPSIKYEYLTQPNGLNAVTTKTISADGQRQHTGVTLYDGLLRPFQTQLDSRSTNPDPARPPERLVTQTVYDSTGRVVKQTEPWTVQGWASTTPENLTSDPLGHTTFEYDEAGRQTAEVFWSHGADNVDYEKWRTVTVYDGAETTKIPPLGGTPTRTEVDARGRTIKLAQYEYDPENHVTAITPATLDQLPTNPLITEYAYDAAGRLTSMLDPADNEWTYEYDWAGRQIAASDPDAGGSSTTYDVLGRVTTRTNGNHQTVAYTYDALSRVTSVRDGSPLGATRATWTYDDSILKGVLTSSTRHVNGQAYTTRTDSWDTAYRPTSTTLELPNSGPFTNLQDRTLTTQYAYTVDGQQSRITYPAVAKADGTAQGKLVLGAEAVTTTYDAGSSMPSWMSGGFGWGTYVAASLFDADGRPISMDLGNTYGAVVTYGYEDATKRLASISLDRERINGTDLDLHYQYDAAGNVTSIKDTPTKATLATPAFGDIQCFDYDELIRLKHAWTPASAGQASPSPSDECDNTRSTAALGGAAPYWTEYQYDLLGNRTEETTRKPGTTTTTVYTSGTGGAGPHAVAKATVSGGPVTTYTYDDAGNRTSATTTGQTPVSYSWDTEGELTATGDSSFIYDADGNRIIRTDPTGTTVYAGSQEIKIASNGTVSATRYYSFAGKTVAVRTDRGLGNGVTSLVSDHHGTPVAAISNGTNPTTANAVSKLYTTPFGGTRGPSTGSTIPGDTQFLGKTRDDATGLTLLGARYYDEKIGRFISVDPILDLTDPQQWNAYSYANGSPVSRADPTGLRPDDTGAYTGSSNKRGHQAIADRADRSSHSQSSVVVKPPVAVVQAADRLKCAGLSPGACQLSGSIIQNRSEQDAEFWRGARELGSYGPGIGAPLDIWSGVECAAAGDWLCAALDGVGVFPGPGDLIKGAGKGGKAAVEAGLDLGRRSADNYAMPIGPSLENVNEVLRRADSKGAPLPNYSGGKTFKNLDGTLPEAPGLKYREWDVHPNTPGPRGPERLVTGSDGSAYYTRDHYKTFMIVRGALP